MRRRRSVTVQPGTAGGWFVGGGGLLEKTHFLRKRDATLHGRELLQHHGGGELIVHNLSGRIVDRDEVVPRQGR